jgi:hypothetical protein
MSAALALPRIEAPALAHVRQKLPDDAIRDVRGDENDLF